MDNKKTIIVFVAAAVVIWVFWIIGSRDVVTSTLRQGLGIDNVPSTQEQVENIQPVSLAGHPKFGNYITDASGRTLYMTTKEECAGDCLSVWPPYAAKNAISNGSGKLGTAQNEAAGLLQYTWDGTLLYYYIEDAKPGDVKGHEFGGAWFLVQE